MSSGVELLETSNIQKILSFQSEVFQKLFDILCQILYNNCHTEI